MAEVLITLTIIGVIAAIAIPNLMQSWKKHEVEVKLKESYSVLSNTLKMAQAEYGNLDDTLLESNWPDKYLIPYLKAKQINNPYGSRQFKLIDGRMVLGGYFDHSVYRHLQLDNGIIIGICRKEGGQLFMIDLNGAKNPNWIGHDIFFFGMVKSGTGSHCDLPGNAWCNQGGKLLGGPASYECYADRTRSCGLKLCDEEFGTYCSAVIMNNGWKIPDNYPIKKW